MVMRNTDFYEIKKSNNNNQIKHEWNETKRIESRWSKKAPNAHTGAEI